jgi:hypothetical protein
MVIERLHGPSMVQALRRRPWRAYAYGRVLAGPHNRLHALEAPGWLPRRFVSGPYVIDWCNAAAGDPAADSALTVAILRGVVPPGVERALLSAFLLGFRQACAWDPGPRMADAVAARLTNPNLLPAEAERLARPARSS